MYDCIVVGAGPAGSSTAYHLAKHGYGVLLLEKSTFPRYKPCSGALSPSVAEWFDFDFEPAIDRKVRRVRYTWQMGDEIISQLQTQDPIWIVQRAVFDELLVQQAIASGSIFKDSTPATGIAFQQNTGRWTVKTPDTALQARYLVAADGANGPLASWLGFKSPKLKTGATLEIPVAAPLDETCALNFEFGMVKNGCMWNFPKHQGYGIGAATFLGKGPEDYQTVLTAYADSFGTPYNQGIAYPYTLKLWDGHRPLHTQQAVIVGEAAAIVDPLTAEGIRHGLYSGLKAAEAIHQALQGTPQALAYYTQAMQDWGRDMQWAQRIASVFYRVTNLGYQAGLKRPSATKRMGQVLAGDIKYSDIANRVIKRMTTGLIPGRG